MCGLGKKKFTLLKDAMPKQMFVAGMHHTGTSIVSKLMLMMGIFGGDDADLLRHPTNPLKYWEHRDVVRLNQEHLDSCTTPGALPAWTGWGYEAPSARSDFLRGIQRFVAHMPRNASWMTKDPRLSLVLGDWVAAVSNPVCVVVQRNPVAVVDTMLSYSTHATIEDWVHVYAQYYGRIGRACAGLPTIVVEHERVVRDPYGTVLHLKRHFDALGIEHALPERRLVERLLDGGAAADGTPLSGVEATIFEPALRLWRTRAVEAAMPWSSRSAAARNESYATLLTRADPDYLKGAVALGASIRGFDASRTMTALLTPEVPPAWEASLELVGWTVRRIAPMREFWWGQCPEYSADQEKRWGAMMSKLKLWQLPFARVIYMDADAVATGPPPDATDELVAEAGKHHPHFNAGVMLLRPDPSTFDKLVALGAAPPPRLFDNAVDCTEQALLNLAFPGARKETTLISRADATAPLNGSFVVHWITHACPKPWTAAAVPPWCDADAYKYWTRVWRRVAHPTLDATTGRYVGPRSEARRLMQAHERGDAEYDGDSAAALRRIIPPPPRVRAYQAKLATVLVVASLMGVLSGAMVRHCVMAPQEITNDMTEMQKKNLGFKRVALAERYDSSDDETSPKGASPRTPSQ